MEKLPLDITSIILSRLPFRSVGQGRCVSKLWSSILSDSQFPITQLTQNSKIPSDLIVFYHDPNQRVPNIFYVEANENGELPIKPFKTFDSEFIRKFYSLPYILGACHGFICISQTNFFNISLLPCNPIYVLNTVTGEHSAFPHFKLPKREVPDWIEEGKKTDKCLSGFGFDESIKKFKFVLVVFGAQDYNAQIFRNNVQVHTLGSTNWRRKVGIVPNELHKSHSKVSFTFVSGFLHWVTIDESSEKEAPLIVTFNLSAEVFGYVPTPESNQLKYPFHCYDVAVFDQEYLSFVETSPEKCTQIWIMNKYNVGESWVKLFCIQHDLVSKDDLSCVHVELVRVCKDGELLLLCNHQYLVYYNLTSKEFRHFEVDGMSKRSKYFTSVDRKAYVRAHSTVGSLFSLKSAWEQTKRMVNP